MANTAFIIGLSDVFNISGMFPSRTEQEVKPQKNEKLKVNFVPAEKKQYPHFSEEFNQTAKGLQLLVNQKEDVSDLQKAAFALQKQASTLKDAIEERAKSRKRVEKAHQNTLDKKRTVERLESSLEEAEKKPSQCEQRLSEATKRLDKLNIEELKKALAEIDSHERKEITGKHLAGIAIAYAIIEKLLSEKEVEHQTQRLSVAQAESKKAEREEATAVTNEEQLMESHAILFRDLLN